METFAFLKTMNNQAQLFPSLVVAFISCVAPSAVSARAQTQESSGPDRVAVTLTDPSRPALVKASLINGGITVKAYDGKEVIVEARARNHESESALSDTNNRRITITYTCISVDAATNDTTIST